MILDEKLEFASALSVAAVAGTLLVGDVVDLDDASRKIGVHNLFLVITVTTAFASAGAATVQFKLSSDAQAAIAVDGTETDHWRSDVFAIAELTAGKTIIVPMPGGIPAYERYLGIEVVTGAFTTTAGSINAYLVSDAADWRAFADATN